MVNLGLWQLRRLDERQNQNQLYTDRLVEAPLRTSDLVNPPIGDSKWSDVDLDDLGWEFRPVELIGAYVETESEAIVRNRTLNGRPGVWALTPFQVTPSNQIFAVNRGWIPRELSSLDCRSEEGQEDVLTKAPTEKIVITGILRVAEGTGQQAKCLPRVQLEWLSSLTAPDSDNEFPYWIQLESYQFADSTRQVPEGPIPLESPDRGDGPHFSYAVQWFIFATILAGGYPIILWRNRTP